MKKRQLLNKIKAGIKKVTFLKASIFLFYAFVFLIPFQIDVIVYAQPVYEGGNFNPYTSIFYYLADLVFLLSLISWGLSIFTGEFKGKLTYGKWYVFLFLLLFVVSCEASILFAEDKWLSLMLTLRFIELVILYLFVVNDTVKIDTVINVFIASVSVQASIAVLQYINQGSLGLHMFGEPLISPNTPGVAKIDIDGKNILRSYGTFQHPNILAGYLVAGILFAFHRIRQKEHIAYPVIILMIAALVLTFSRSAFLALLIAFFVFISIKETKVSFKYIFLALSLLVFFVVIFDLEQTLMSKILFADSASFDERVFYFSVAKKIMYSNPFGVGLGNFTIIMQDFSGFKLAPWDFQPVHNIYMLIVNEIGFTGLITFLLLCFSLAVSVFLHQNKLKSTKNEIGVFLLVILSSILVVGLFDHYPISLYQGQLLFFLIIGLSGKYIATKIH